MRDEASLFWVKVLWTFSTRHFPQTKNTKKQRLHQPLSTIFVSCGCCSRNLLSSYWLRNTQIYYPTVPQMVWSGSHRMRSRGQQSWYSFQKMLLPRLTAFLPSLKSAGRQLWISLTLTLCLCRHLSFSEPIKDCSDDVGPIQIIQDNLLGKESLNLICQVRYQNHTVWRELGYHISHQLPGVAEAAGSQFTLWAAKEKAQPAILLFHWANLQEVDTTSGQGRARDQCDVQTAVSVNFYSSYFLSSCLILNKYCSYTI